MPKINLDRVKHIHLIGVGGCGMSAIAKILHQMGYKVSGSDIKENSNTIRLEDLGVKIHLKHRASNLRGADAVVYSSAIAPDNAELEAAKTQGIFILHRAKMLSFILKKHKISIAVAGTHGKTTTTSMIAKILLENNLDPTFLIGGETDYIDGNARLGKGPYAAAEADESDGSFLELDCAVGVVTNIEADHMDYFKTEENLFRHFADFARKIKDQNGYLIVSNHPNCLNHLSKVDVRKITYGFSPELDLSAGDFEFIEGGSKFKVYQKGNCLGSVALSVPGEQNILNSLAAIAFGLESGITFNSISEALQSYTAVKRRFQIVGQTGNIIIVDDYAHHPTEIKATLSAARKNYKQRLIAIFQPHRFTRTLRLSEEFAGSFGDADQVIITDVYSAGEASIPNVSGKTIFDKIKDKNNAVYIPKKEKITDYLLSNLQPNDMVLTLGAGDVNTVGRELLTRLKMKNETAEK